MKIMRYSKPLLVLMMLLTWSSLPFIGKTSIKRFLPASLFISLFVLCEDRIARKKKWWWWYEKLHPKLPGILPYLLGPFFITSLWVLKLTYGRFWRYLLLNSSLHIAFSYVLTNFLKKYGLASLVRLKKIQLTALFIMKALILYGFNYLKEKAFKSQQEIVEKST